MDILQMSHYIYDLFLFPFPKNYNVCIQFFF